MSSAQEASHPVDRSGGDRTFRMKQPFLRNPELESELVFLCPGPERCLPHNMRGALEMFVGQSKFLLNSTFSVFSFFLSYLVTQSNRDVMYFIML